MTQVNNHKSTGHTSFLNGDSLASSEDSLRQQAQRSLLLNRITTQLDQDYDQQLTRALDLIRQAFEFDVAIISHIENDRYTVQYLSTAQDGLEQGQKLELSQTYCESVYQTEDLLVIDHASRSDYKDHPCYQLSQLESYIGTPLRVDGELYGTVTFSNVNPRPEPFTDLDIEFMEIFSNWVSGVLSRQNAAAELKRTVDDMATLYQYTAVLNQATTVEELFLTAIQPSIETGAHSASLFTIQVDHNNRPEFIDLVTSWSATGEEPLPAGTRFALADFEISKYWIASRSPVFIGDIQNDERLSESAREVYRQVGAAATIIFPLILQDKWIGIISLNWPKAREFTEADRRQYQAISGQTAAVLHNLFSSAYESKRAHALEAVSKVSAAVSSILDMPELLQTVVNLTKEQFELYHAHLYLVDKEKNLVTLASGAGEIGQQMVSEGRTIPLDAEQSLVARAARSTSGFIVNDVANEPGFLSHPLLPDTASELAVPIISGDETLGVLDVQSAQINYFDDDDLQILNTLASQIAPALQNAEAFEQIRVARATAQETQKRIEAILQSVTVPLVITRVSDGLAMYANEPLANALRMPLEDILYQRAPDFYDSPEDRQQFLKELMGNGSVNNYEILLRRHDGDPFWALVSARIFNYQGETAIVSTIADITDRKEAQARVETILKAVNLPLAITRISDGFAMYANEPFAEVFRIPVEEFIGKKSPDFYADPADRAGLLKGVNEVGYTKNYETRLKRHDGEIFWALLSARAIVYEGHQSIMTTILDISDRKEATEALRRSQEDLAAILESSPEAIGVLNTETGLFENPNPNAEKLYGLPYEELIKVGPAQMSPEFQPDGRPSGEKAMEKIGEALQGGTPVFEWIHINSQGEEIPCEIRLVSLGGDRSHLVRFSVTDITERKLSEEKLAKQAADLATVAEVSTAVSTIQNTEEMLQTVVDLTKERFNLYHAHIFTLDTETNTLVLRAGAGEIGREMVAEGRRIPLAAEGSLVATAGRSREGQIRNYEGEMEGFAPHPALIDTRTELAVPLIVGDELLGVLDVRSEQENAFTETDIQIQSTLASQTAIALQNARSFEQMKAAEEEQRTSTEFLDAVLSAIPTPVFVKDEEHRWMILNDAMTEWMGQPAEHFLGKSDYDFFPKEEADVFWEKDDLVFRSDEPVVNEEFFTDATGFRRTIITTKVSHELNNQEQILIGSILDVTDLKKTEAELRENQSQLQAILDNLPVGVFVADAKTGVPQLANNEALKLLGRGLDPSSGTEEYTEVYQTYRVGEDEPLPSEELPLVKTMTTGSVNHGQVDIVRPDDRITVDVTAVPIFDDNDNMTSAIALFQDVTERREAEAQLRLQSTALEAAANGIAITDLRGNLIRVNSAFTELTGYSAEEAVGKSTRILKSGEQSDEFYADMWQTVLNGEVWQGELVNRRKDGSLYTEEMTITPMRASDEEITHFIAIKQDITERKQLVEQIEQLAAVVENSPDFIGIGTLEGQALYVNPAGLEMLGAPADEEVTALNASDFYPEEDAQKLVAEGIPQTLEQGFWSNEAHLKRRDGSSIPVDQTVGLIRNAEGVPYAFSITMRDITQQRQAQDAIIKQAAELETVAEIGITVSSSLDTDQVLQEVVELTKKNFDLYHAHIYLLDESGENLMLTAGAGKAGRQMVEQKRSIAMTAQSLVAQAARSGEAVIANNVLQDPNFLPNPILPNTRSEMAVPIVFGGTTLGVLDVQDDKTNRFDEQDVNIQTTLATEVAVAIENARQYEQTQRALAETAAQAESLEKLSALSLALTSVAEEEEAFKTVATYATDIVGSQRTSITLLNDEQTHLELFTLDGIQGSIPTNTILPVDSTAVGRTVLDEQIMTITNTAESNFMDAVRLSQSGVLSAVVAPLSIRNEIIGTMNFGFLEPVEHDLGRDQLVQQLTSLFGQTLANSRLLTQIQQQATQLGTVTELGTNIAKVSDPQEMVQTVVDLTKERFGLYHAHIFLLDENQETLVLTAGADEIGREMVAEGRRIPYTAEGSLVATAARTREPQIRHYEGEMEGYAPHPALIDTRTEMAVPLLVGNQLLGVLDVRSEEENAFDTTDVQIQSTLASQVAIALQNARQYEQTQNALAETAEQAQSLAQLTELSLALANATTEEEAFKTMAPYATSIVDSQRTSIALLNANKTHLELFAIDGDQGSIPTGMVLPADGTAIGTVAREGHIMTISETASSEFMDAQKLSQSGILSAIVAPLTIGAEVIGTLNFGYTTVIEHSDRTNQLIQQITSLFGQTMANSRLLTQIQQQANQLRTVAQVGTSISRIQDSQEMLQTVVDLTKESFNLYHAHTFLLNDAGDTLILTAGAGEVGREMVAEGRRIPYAAEGSLVATAARTRQPQIRNYEGEMEGFNPHPALIDTRTEMAVPLLVGDSLLGVFDIRSEQENAFSEVDVQIQSTLASQIAIALQNARQFEQTERARRELSVITQRLTREGWDEFLTDREEDVLRYGYNLQAVHRLADDQASNANTDTLVSAPLVVQDAELGHLALEFPEEPDRETADVVSAIVNNLSAHIENIRLNEQTFKALADTEALYDASDKIVRATTIQSILQALVESTVLQQMDRANIFTFNKPWAEEEPAYAIVEALWERDGTAEQSLISAGTIYHTNQITTMRSFRRDEVVVYKDILTDERVDPLSRQILSDLGVRSLYVFPLVVNQQWLGVVTAQSSEPDYHINEANLRQINTLIDQAATSIANRRLLAQAQERAERERRVRAITDRIRNGANREAILKIAREEINNLLGTNKSVVQLGTQQQLISKLSQNNGRSE